jgi:small subunit ribosomal protein S20
MANIASQIKRNRQNEKRRQRNQALRSEIRTRSRRALEAAEAGDAAAAHEALRGAQSRIDIAAARSVLHKRTAGRRKAQLARQVQQLLG